MAELEALEAESEGLLPHDTRVHKVLCRRELSVERVR
jgi:hypothetical protein